MYHLLGPDGREYGPASAEQVRAWAAENRVHAQTPTRAVGQSDWRPLGSFSEVWMLSPPQFPRALPPGVVASHIAPAILVTLCCCQPFGIIAIVFGAQVSGRLSAGDLPGAQSASRTALMWCWLGVGFGLLSCLAGSGLALLSSAAHH